MIRVVVSSDAIELPQGSLIKVPASWQDYQTLLGHLGDRAISFRETAMLLFSRAGSFQGLISTSSFKPAFKVPISLVLMPLINLAIAILASDLIN